MDVGFPQLHFQRPPRCRLGALCCHLGPRWGDAFRQHLRRLAVEGVLGPDVVAVGSFWADGRDELDAVVLAGRARRATWIGEAKWTADLDARGIEAALHRKAASLPDVAADVRVALCARSSIAGAAPGTLVVTAADIFGLPDEQLAPPARKVRRRGR